MATFNRWRVQLFGVLQVRSNEETITRFYSQMTGSLFAYLAYHNGRPQPREVLIDQMWPDADLKRGRERLSHALSSLRTQFAIPESELPVFFADNFTVALNADLFEIDTAAFQNALKRARRTSDSKSRRELLEEAIGYYEDDFLHGRYESWILTEKQFLQQQFEDATTELRSLARIDAASLHRAKKMQQVVIEDPSDASIANHHEISPVLPPTYTRFFGRTTELVELASIFTPTPQPTLITLTGIGGIGKSRLAHEVASRLQSVYKGRVWFVRLAEIQDAERILESVRETLRLPSDPSASILDQCVSYLASAPSLLVLDNMEQFAHDGRAAIILQSLRERIATLKCLVTSRHVLRIDGERAYPVRPLTGSEEITSINLFDDRARAVRPDFRINDNNRPTVQKLCAALDGIPLAIELAAARIGVFSPAQLLSEMERRFIVLRSRKRDVPSRHQSLWAAIDSSYQLLPAPIRQFFTRLSLFRGGWTIDSAASICLNQDDRDIDDAFETAVDYLAELHEASLILPTDVDGESSRFQMLDTLRDYATEQLAKEEEAQGFGRHADYFSNFAASAEPFLAAGVAGQEAWLSKLGREHDNFRIALSRSANPVQALRMANSLLRFWLVRGHETEGYRHLSKAFSVATNIADTAQSDLATAQHALGVLSLMSGAGSDAREHFGRALAHYEASGDQGNIARSLNNLGIVAVELENYAEARSSYEKSFAIYQALGDNLRQSMVLTNLSVVYVFLEDYNAARKVLNECLPIQKAAGDDLTLIRTLQNMAEVALRQEDFLGAASALTESLKIRRVLGDQSAFGDTLATASVILGRSQRMESACIAWFAAQSHRAAAGTTPSPAYARDEQAWFEQIQHSLAETIIAEKMHQARRMTFEETISWVESLLYAAPTDTQ